MRQVAVGDSVSTTYSVVCTNLEKYGKADSRSACLVLLSIYFSF